jgi:hypothetical protein
MVKFLKINRAYLLIGLVFLIVNSLLFLLTKPTAAMELFYYPWLVEKGLLMYRDFFHNHGPFLNYLLAPLTLDKSLTSLKIFYVLVQNINLILVLVLIKKFSRVSGFIIGGIAFIILNFYFAYNYFWDEHIFATLFLLIYYLIGTKDFSLKPACLGVLIGLLGLIKPNVLIILIPVLLFYKKRSFLIYPIVMWLLVALYFFTQNALPQLIDNYISSNFFYQNHARNRFPYLSVVKNMMFFINFLIVIFVFAIHSINKKNINSKLIIFFLLSLVTIYPGVNDERFVPFASFLAIFIVYLFTITNKKLFFIVVLLLYTIGFSYQAKSKAVSLIHLPTVIEESRNQKIISYLKTKNLYQKSFYIMSNNPEIYYVLDRPIQLYFPLMYPSISGYYTNYQDTYINDIKRNKTELVIIPQPLSPIYAEAKSLIAFVKGNYKLSHKDNDFLIYTIKTH